MIQKHPSGQMVQIIKYRLLPRLFPYRALWTIPEQTIELSIISGFQASNSKMLHAGILTDTDSDDPDGLQENDDGFEAYDLTEDDPTDGRPSVSHFFRSLHTPAR